MASSFTGYHGEYNPANQRHGYGIFRQQLQSDRSICIEGEWEFGLLSGTATVSVNDEVIYNGTWTEGFMDDASSCSATSQVDVMQVR